MPWECEDCGYPGCGDSNCLDNRESLQDEINRLIATGQAKLVKFDIGEK